MTQHTGWTIEDEDEQAVILRHQAARDPAPDDWPARLREGLDTFHSAAVVTGRRLAGNDTIFSLGEFIVHPKGFHHHGQGVPAEGYRFPVEVECVSGGVAAVARQAFDACGGLAAWTQELGPMHCCLSIRAAGGRVLSIPDVRCIDESIPSPTDEARASFQERWGFDWLAADLDAVRERHGGTGLMWNERFWGAPMPFEKYRHRPAMHWTAYAQVPVYRSRADQIVSFLTKMLPMGRVLDLGCGDGLFSHLLAMRGYEVTGIDTEPEAIEQAEQQTGSQRYPKSPPTFELTDGAAIPGVGDGYHAVVMLDVIEHLPNPVGLLRRLTDVIVPDGLLMLSTPAWQYEAWSDSVYHVCEYNLHELVRQIQACGYGVAETARIGEPYRDLIVVGRRPSAPSDA